MAPTIGINLNTTEVFWTYNRFENYAW